MSVNQTLSSRWPVGLTDAIKAVVRPLAPTALAKSSRPRHQGGAAEILELALLVPIAMTLILGIVEFSLLTSNTSILANAARVAVREAIRRPPTVTTPWTEAQVKNFAKQAAAKLPLVDGNITLTLTPSGSWPAVSGTSITVAISYPYQWLFLSNLYKNNPFTLNASSTMRVP